MNENRICKFCKCHEDWEDLDEHTNKQSTLTYLAMFKPLQYDELISMAQALRKELIDRREEMENKPRSKSACHKCNCLLELRGSSIYCPNCKEVKRRFIIPK